MLWIMKNVLAILLFVPILLVSCEDDDNPNDEIPSIILNEFRVTFPDAKDIDWDKRTNGYEVDFETNNRDYAAFLNPKGDIIKVKYEISEIELPAEIRTSLSKNYENKDIDDPEVIEENGDKYYQVQIEELLIDKNMVIKKTGEIDTNIPYWD